MPIGYRFCRVCNLKNQRCLVPLIQGPVSACEATGVMCETAESVKRWQTISFYGVFVIFGAMVFFDFKEKRDTNMRASKVRYYELDDEKAIDYHKSYVLGTDKDRNVYLPSSELEQAFTGTYKERGATGHTYYTIRMSKPEDSTKVGYFEGRGRDNDGTFKIRNAVYSAKTGRLAWAEHSVESDLIATCEVECVDEACIEMKGFYMANTGIEGSLRLTRKLALDEKTKRQKEMGFSSELREEEEKSEKVKEEEKEEQKGWFDFLSYTSEVQDEEKDEWVRALDQQSGQFYYWNRKSRQTTWTKPEGVVIVIDESEIN